VLRFDALKYIRIGRFLHETGPKLLHPDDVVYNDLLLYHVGGTFANIARAAWDGCTVAAWEKFNPFEFWNRINASGATSAILIDVIIPWLMIPEETPEDRRNTLKHIHMQPLPEYHHTVARRFGMRPKHIRFIDMLPQAPTYKVEKYKLRGKILRELGRIKDD
jgi:acyl-CoA synthetase (AMP-forming)/AMP-acid ligase II